MSTASLPQVGTYLGQSTSESFENWITRITTRTSAHSAEQQSWYPAEADNVVKQIDEVFSHDTLGKSGTRNFDGDEDEEEVEEEDIDPELQKLRTDKLRKILPNLAYLWWTDSEQLDTAAEKLADGSRDYTWRLSMGESGILCFFLEIFSRFQLRDSLSIHILRLIGNSCADRDENRERMIASPNYISSLILKLNDISSLPYTLPVLFNICVNYEPIQLLVSKSHLTQELIKLISSSVLDNSESLLGHSCRILALLASLPCEIDYAPKHTPIVLLRRAADHNRPVNLDNFICLANIAVSYLQHEKFQKSFLNNESALDAVLTVLPDSYTRLNSQTSMASVATQNEKLDDAKALTSMRNGLNQVFSDLSALPEFREVCPISSKFSSTLQSWLLSTEKQIQLQVCACVMLGNLARLDDTCIEFVRELQIHFALFDILSNANSSQLLHAALGFLKNLAIPLENKIILGEKGIFQALSRVWVLDTMPEVRFSSISLGRQLTIGSFPNVRRLIQERSITRTYLSLLNDIFEKTDDEPIKMEISRLTISMCRVLHSHTENSQEEMDLIRTRLYQKYAEINTQLVFAVSQTKWPVVRSEGWFVLALMARFPRGAEFVFRLLYNTSIYQSLLEMLTGKPEAQVVSPPTMSLDHELSGSLDLVPEPIKPDTHAIDMVRLDRENILVLLSEMLKNYGSEMTAPRKTTFKDLLRGGGQRVLSHQQGKD